MCTVSKLVCRAARSLTILQLVSGIVVVVGFDVGCFSRRSYECELMNEIVHIYCLLGADHVMRREEERRQSYKRQSGPIVRRWIDGDVLMEYEFA